MEDTTDTPVRGRERIPLLMWVLLLITVIAAALFAVPRILSAYRDSGLSDKVARYLARPRVTSGTEEEAFPLFFATQDTVSGTIQISRSFRRLPAETARNSLFEQLLSGPSLDELQQGYISFIPDQTRLIGSTVRDSVAYIEVSADLLSIEEPELGYALSQLLSTAASEEGIRGAVVLVEGSFILSTQQSSFP